MPRARAVTSRAPCISEADLLAHIKWARGIARNVRRWYRFYPGSQEEQDLESTAITTILELAERYEPPAALKPGTTHRNAFQGWASQQVRKECIREGRRMLNAGTYYTRRDETIPGVVPLYMDDEGHMPPGLITGPVELENIVPVRVLDESEEGIPYGRRLARGNRRKGA